MPLLAAHAAHEDGGILAALAAADVDPACLDGFLADHVRLHALAGDAAAGSRAAAAALVRLLRDHIAREESDLFPTAHQLLTPVQWDAIEAIDRSPAA